MSTLADYAHRNRLKITGTADGIQTNYQIKLTVYYGAGTSTGASVYLDKHCKNDFSDIRFTSSDGATLLDYWIESTVALTSVVVWVEVDTIPITGGSIYIYYGNASATSASSGVNTFELFDDFDGVAFDVDKWVKGGVTPPIVSVASGRLTLTGVDSNWSAFGSITKFGQNHAMDYYVYSFTNVATTYGLDGGFSNYYFSDSAAYASAISHKLQTLVNNNNGTVSSVAITGAQTIRAVHTVRRLSASSKYSLNYGTETSLATNVQTVDERIAWDVTGNTAIGKIVISWARVRSTTTTEPVPATWTAIENNPSTFATWIDDTYKYRLQLPIVPTVDGAQTNYQMKLTVNSGVGTITAGAVYLNSLALNWPNDIRFTKSDGTTLLDFWRESYTSTSAVIWVEVDVISATAETDIYLYYCKLNDTDASNGDNTFPLYDHFLGASINTNKWTNPGGATVSGSIMTITGNAKILYSNTIFSLGYAMRSYGTLVKTTSDFMGFNSGNVTKHVSIQGHNGGHQIYYQPPPTAGGLFNIGDDSNNHIWELRRLPGVTDNIIAYIDNTLVTTNGTKSWATIDDLYVGYYTEPGTITSDWVVVRKVTATEPTWATPTNSEIKSTYYNYKVRIPINFTADGAQTNYQIKLTLNSGVGTNTSTNIYLNEHSLNYPYDIRFTKADGTTLLDYWVESTVGAVSVVWVEMPIIEATGTTDCYLYYGKASEVDGGSGDNTFYFFDDFNGAVVDTNKWTTAANITVSGGRATIVPDSGWTRLVGKTSFAVGYTLRSKYRWYDPGTPIPRGLSVAWSSTGLAPNLCDLVWYVASWSFVRTWDASSNYADTAWPRETTTPHTCELQRYTGGIKGVKDEVVYGPITTALYVGTVPISFHNIGDPGTKTEIYWALVRKQAVAEPTIATPGLETSTAPVTTSLLMSPTGGVMYYGASCI